MRAVPREAELTPIRATNADALLTALDRAVDDAFEADQVPLLRELVELPSYSEAKADVEVAARCFDEAAAAAGLSRTVHPDGTGRYADHRVYATPATGPDDPAVALVGHIDTVFPRSLGFLTFERDGDTIRGPGVLDMKSGLTVILFALRAVRQVAPAQWARLKARVVLNSDEEVGSPSSRDVLKALAPVTTAALVFEAGRAEDRVITRRKGLARITVEATGQAAHAGLAHARGVNAIHALALVIPAIEGLTDYDRGVTLNVGLIEGGTAKNTVPDRATCLIDGRFETVRDADETLAALRATVEGPLPESAPARLREHAALEVSGGLTRPPMEASEASQALRLRYETQAGAVGLKVGEAPLQAGGSDANLLSAYGVPSIDGLGPYGRNYHRVDEWSSLSSLKRRTQALARFLATEAGLDDE